MSITRGAVLGIRGKRRFETVDERDGCRPSLPATGDAVLGLGRQDAVMTRERSNRGGARRAVAIVAVILLLLVMSLIIIGMLHGGARDQDLSVRRIETIRAFCAAEGGMNMALREWVLNDDEDGDGTVATISADGIDANDPFIGTAQVVVTSSSSGSQTTLTSTGRSGQAERRVRTVIE